MVIGRHDSSLLDSSKDMPSDWTDALTNILNATYESRSIIDNAFFDVLGKIFENETILIISYLDKEDYSKSPITLFVSVDNSENEKGIKKALDTSVKLISLIFDDIFANEDWNEYVYDWTENQLDGAFFYYKITRENFSLTLQAEEILKGNI